MSGLCVDRHVSAPSIGTLGLERVEQPPLLKRSVLAGPLRPLPVWDDVKENAAKLEDEAEHGDWDRARPWPDGLYRR